MKLKQTWTFEQMVETQLNQTRTLTYLSLIKKRESDFMKPNVTNGVAAVVAAAAANKVVFTSIWNSNHQNAPEQSSAAVFLQID